MKAYRCIFKSARGNTTIDVVAADAKGALSEAQLTVKSESDTIEIWDETGKVIEHKRNGGSLSSGGTA